MPYRALQDMLLNSEVKAGEIITPEQIAGRDPQVLIRLELVEYFVGETPKPAVKTDRTETPAPKRETEEVFTPVEEKSSDPVKAEVVKSGVWYKVFAGSIQVGKPTRDEKIAKKIAKDFNAKL